ncbi:hypothetical protein KQ313_04165 [Synechococcus sp. CS-1325]|uniref:hypothetical protein n=1 Tax=unclassified Synechococcus TaxID=2626047 RepID=UPI000DB196D3|nr:MULTISPECIES: hypothetical protein [unclassified Synechococcus]PZV00096.1 MAG: hypothetical protein DCF24_08025 [Cyanobium sp.]MCT0198875.1 hypothetical protein [Synechococcus sp. CS-1325]MCT0212131.1 hypothetical protein [Synechococcus sp. CS-1326]MCT0229437.1 hypothetical protein [Synechococcus sp. CS-1324]MCT0232919.1 hypothetical protein [Synechococcus sp. CS-1327]
MPWDPAILRKFNTTGHFRLLNQLRAEIKAHPLPRQKGVPQDQSGGLGGLGTGPIELRPQPMGYVRSRRSGSYGSSSSSQSAGFSPSLDNSAEGASMSFRDRLNAIEMR